ncbi:MAG: c-type cytochrome domain-containing protein [Verrucomicrobiota bacterium]
MNDSERDNTELEGDRRRPGRGVALITVAFLLWFVAVVAMAIAFRSGDAGMQGGIFNWLGRAHLLILHFPIGMLFLVIALEVLRFLRLIRIDDESTIVATLVLTFLGAIVASVLGYLLMGTESFAGRAVSLHMWTGLAVVFLTYVTLKFKLSNLSRVYYYGALGLSAIGISAAGHYGGSMVHGSDYFTEFAPPMIKKVMAPGSIAEADADVGSEKGVVNGAEVAAVSLEDKSVYLEYVHPILEAKCNECHNEDKIKGDLRMDTYELLMVGSEGSPYPTVIPGDPEESELIVRVTLPEDDGDFMPPKGPGLTEEEIAILKLWIGAGAKQDTRVSDIGEAGVGLF